MDHGMPGCFIKSASCGGRPLFLGVETGLRSLVAFRFVFVFPAASLLASPMLSSSSNPKRFDVSGALWSSTFDFRFFCFTGLIGNCPWLDGSPFFTRSWSVSKRWANLNECIMASLIVIFLRPSNRCLNWRPMFSSAFVVVCICLNHGQPSQTKRRERKTAWATGFQAGAGGEQAREANEKAGSHLGEGWGVHSGGQTWLEGSLGGRKRKLSKKSKIQGGQLLGLSWSISKNHELLLGCRLRIHNLSCLVLVPSRWGFHSGGAQITVFDQQSEESNSHTLSHCGHMGWANSPLIHTATFEMRPTRKHCPNAHKENFHPISIRFSILLRGWRWMEMDGDITSL